MLIEKYLLTTLEGLPPLGTIIRQAMALNGEIFVQVQRSPQGIWIALLIVGLAGLSESLGQSVILFVNRARPRRFLLALFISAINYMVGYVLWSVSVWLVGFYAFERNIAWTPVAVAVGLAYAPQLLAFFELTPFFGNPFGILLSLWSMLAIVVAVRTGMDMEMWQAVVTSGLGWLLIQVWRQTLGRPVYMLGQWIERRAVGVPLEYTVKDLPSLRRPSKYRDNWERLVASTNAQADVVGEDEGEGNDV